MPPGIFDDASMTATVLRVRDVAASVEWYRDKLGLQPIHMGADGPDHPVAAYVIAGSVVSPWQLCRRSFESDQSCSSKVTTPRRLAV